MKDDIGAFPTRAKAIRAGHGIKQELFVPVVNAMAVSLFGDKARIYSQSTYSRIESGRQAPSLEDVAVIAACDKEHRGILWLGWDADADFTIAAKPITPKASVGVVVRPTVYTEGAKKKRPRRNA